MRTLIFLLTTLLTITTFASKVGYVDIDKVLPNLAKIQEASEDIKKNFSPRESEIIALSKKLEIRAKKFNANKATMLQDEANKEIKSLLESENTLKQKTEQLKRDIQSVNEIVLQEVQNDINIAIAKIAEQENFDIILYQNVAYVSATSNITDSIIKELQKLE